MIFSSEAPFWFELSLSRLDRQTAQHTKQAMPAEDLEEGLCVILRTYLCNTNNILVLLLIVIVEVLTNAWCKDG